jgi:uncharacterized protein YegP (UPF0339 family)
MKVQVFSRKKLVGRRQWHFRVVGANGEIVAQSEGYFNRADMMSTLRLLRSQLPKAEIVDA